MTHHFSLPTRKAFGTLSTAGNAAFVIPWFFQCDKIMMGFVLRKDGSFGFPGGKVEGDETLVQAAVRESLEEVNMEVCPELLKDGVSYFLDNGFGVHTYHLQLVNGPMSARSISRNAMDATHSNENFGMVWVDILNSKHFKNNQFASAVKLEVEHFLREVIKQYAQ